MKTIAIKTLGCKTNQYETNAILNEFVEDGYKLVDFSDKADIYLINTCCVTEKAESKTRYAIRKAIKNKKEKTKIIVAGCYVELKKDFLLKNQGSLLLFNNNEKKQIFQVCTSKKKSYVEKNVNKFLEFNKNNFIINTNTRIPIKVQDGCDLNCSYCILPYVRGKPKSRNPKYVIDQIQHLVNNGTNEIILTGINLGLYGKEWSDYNLVNLISDISTRTKIKRIRLSSIEPMFWSKEFIDNIAENPKICPHFHIPLQSGSDRILAQMNRTYNKREFYSIIINIKKKIPKAAIGCDVIVGFPGETEARFLETFDFIKSLEISYLHVFRFSPRNYTKAYLFKETLSSKTKKIRVRKLINLGEKKRRKYFDKLIKNRVPLNIVLECNVRGKWRSLSDHYAKIYIEDHEYEQGSLKTVMGKKIINNGEAIIAQEI